MGRRSRTRFLENPTLNEAFLELRADYSAARMNRYRRRRQGVPVAGSHADYHYRSDADYLRIVEYSRDMDRNDMVVGQGVWRLVDNVVRDGFGLDPRGEDTDVNTQISQRWTEWSEDPDACDVMGEWTFHDMEAQCFRSSIVDGDIWPVLTDPGLIQIFEAHRVRTPSNAMRRQSPPVHGVVMDGRRKRRYILVTKEDINPSTPLNLVSDVKEIPVRDGAGHRVVLQIYRPNRVTQTRGVSCFAPIFDPIGMHDDLQFAKLVQHQVASCFAIFRELDGNAPGLPGDERATEGEQRTETRTDGTTRTIEGIAPGMDIEGRPGEKLHGFSPNIPNPEFFPHATLILTFIAINLGLPVAVLLLDPSETNFSGWRGAIDQARIGFRRMQRLLIRRFHRPVYLWKLRQWVAEDPALAAAAREQGLAFWRHKWHPPGWDYIEPLKDASADLLRTRNCLISQRRRCAERGIDWEDLAVEIVEDNALLIKLAWEKAEALNKEFQGLNVTWREVASLPTPDGVTISVSGDDSASSRGGKNKTNPQNGDSDGRQNRT